MTSEPLTYSLRSWRARALLMDQRRERWNQLSTEHLSWLSHLSAKYQLPAAALARQLSPADLALEIAQVIVDTGRLSANRLIRDLQSDDSDRQRQANGEIAKLAERPDILARVTRHYLAQLQAEIEAREQEEADDILTAYQLQMLQG